MKSDFDANKTHPNAVGRAIEAAIRDRSPAMNCTEISVTAGNRKKARRINDYAIIYHGLVSAVAAARPVIEKTMAQIEISFITPLFNCLPYTKQYLLSLAETLPNLPHEIILVDDYSTDGTREFLKSLPDPPYRVFLNSANLGFAKSSNLGAHNAKGRYLCFLNNDLILKPGWFEPMYELARSAPDIGAVGNIQLEPETGLVHHAGVFFDWEGRPLHAWRYRRRGPTGDSGEWNAITAACFLIEAEKFRGLEGFDEAYKNGFEDIDLCVRLRQKGNRLLVSYRSVIDHHASISPGRKKYDDENRERFLSRWQSVSKAWGRKEWPAQYVHRYARAWWKMVPWRMAQGMCILAFRRLSRWKF